MHKLPEQEKLARAVDSYRRGLMLSEMSEFSKHVIDGWVKRYRIAMELEQAKRRKKVQAEKEKDNDCNTDSV